MEILPEVPETINAQLRQLPAYRVLLEPAPEPLAPATSRLVATLMQLKDTAAILLLLSNGYLLFGILFGFGIPGLVLYGLRWRQVRGRAGRGAVVTQAVFSLLHELFWTYTFHGQSFDNEPINNREVLIMLYGLGALLSVLQLVAILLDGTDDYEQSEV